MNEHPNWKSIEEMIGPRYAACRVSNFELHGTPANQKLQQEVIDDLRAYRSTLPETNQNIVFFGPPGTGKDHLMAAMLREAAMGGMNVWWVNGVVLFADIRDAIDSKVTESLMLKKYTSPNILAISDPAPDWRSLTPFQTEFLFKMVDERYRHNRPTWVTTNIADDAEGYKKMSEQVMGRLYHDALTLKCVWPTYRRPVKGKPDASRAPA